MAVSSVSDVVNCYEVGKFRLGNTARKNMALSWTNGFWTDTTMFAGQPGPQYYASAPLVFEPMARSTHGGWDHGPNVSPDTKYLKRMDLMNLGFSLAGMVVDILGYVPFIDEATVGDAQIVDNATNPVAPRHGAGVGVRAYLVSVAPSSLVSGNTVTVTYTNSDGVAGRSTGPVPIQNSQNANGVLLNAGLATHLGPFLPLQKGDVGIRSVESVTVNGPGDVGLFTLVLCRPICNLPTIPGVTTTDTAPRMPIEVDFLRNRAILPVIQDDAYVSCIAAHYNMVSTGITLGALISTFDVIWG